MKNNLRWIMGVYVAACLAGIATSLQLWGAIEVRSDPVAVLVLTFLGAVWISVAFKIFPWLGLSYAYDVVDDKNNAAAVTLSGATGAVAILYACGNLGEGPSYLENFFSAGLGTAAWFLLWLLLEANTRVSVSITEERDLASGLRMGGLLLAAGLLLGRATAGNWVLESATIRDLIHDGWPAAALFVLAVPVEWLARPSRSRPFPRWMSCGAFPAFCYLAVAVAWLWHLGNWEGMP